MDNKVISNKVYESIQPYTTYPTTSGKILYANKYADTSPVDMPEDIKELLDSDVGLNGTNLLIQLRNKFMFRENGPWYVDSRDGVIYIHNRKFQEEPVKTYTYQNENGEVLKVQFQTNWVTKSTKVVLHEGIDPVTKKTESIQTKILGPEERDKDKKISRPLVYDYDMEWKDMPWHAFTSLPPRTVTELNSNPELLQEYYIKHAVVPEAKKMVENIEAQKEYMARVAQDPNLGYADAQNKMIKGMDATSAMTAIKTTIEDKDIPDNIKRQLNILAQDYELAKDPVAYGAKLAEILEGVEYEGLVDDSTIEMVMDPLDYKEGMFNPTPSGYSGQYAGTGKYSDVNRREARFRNLELMKRDPNIIVIEGSVEIDTRYDEGPIKVKIIRRGLNKIKVPLIKIYQNYFGRYGGLKTYLWAANANKNGGLKNKEKEVKVLMTVVGRPMLTSSMVINIQNIGKKWSGAWYVKKCTHKMNISNGYTCDLELVRNSAMAGASSSRMSLSSNNVLHVYTDQNGKTTYGRKPEEERASAFMASFNKQEIAFYTEGMVSGERDAIRDVAIKMAYNEKYADDPYKLSEGTVRIDNVTSTKDGITTLSVARQIDPAEEGLSEERIQHFEKQLEDPKVLGKLRYYQSESYKRKLLEDDAREAKAKSKKEMQDKTNEMARFYFENFTGLGVISGLGE